MIERDEEYFRHNRLHYEKKIKPRLCLRDTGFLWLSAIFRTFSYLWRKDRLLFNIWHLLFFC